jgi:hypothetical protein
MEMAQELQLVPVQPPQELQLVLVLDQPRESGAAYQKRCSRLNSWSRMKGQPNHIQSGNVDGAA